MAASVDRLEAVANLVKGLKESYPDAKRLTIDIHFDWVESNEYVDPELCPFVKVEVER